MRTAIHPEQTKVPPKHPSTYQMVRSWLGYGVRMGMYGTCAAIASQLFYNFYLSPSRAEHQPSISPYRPLLGIKPGQCDGASFKALQTFFNVFESSGALFQTVGLPLSTPTGDLVAFMMEENLEAFKCAFSAQPNMLQKTKDILLGKVLRQFQETGKDLSNFITYLIDQGAQVNLQTAVHHSKQPFFSTLVHTPLIAAFHQLKPDLFAALLEKGASPNAQVALNSGVMGLAGDKLPTIELLVEELVAKKEQFNNLTELEQKFRCHRYKLMLDQATSRMQHPSGQASKNQLFRYQIYDRLNQHLCQDEFALTLDEYAELHSENVKDWFKSWSEPHETESQQPSKEQPEPPSELNDNEDRYKQFQEWMGEQRQNFQKSAQESEVIQAAIELYQKAEAKLHVNPEAVDQVVLKIKEKFGQLKQSVNAQLNGVTQFATNQYNQVVRPPVEYVQLKVQDLQLAAQQSYAEVCNRAKNAYAVAEQKVSSALNAESVQQLKKTTGEALNAAQQRVTETVGAAVGVATENAAYLTEQATHAASDVIHSDTVQNLGRAASDGASFVTNKIDSGLAGATSLVRDITESETAQSLGRSARDAFDGVTSAAGAAIDSGISVAGAAAQSAKDAAQSETVQNLRASVNDMIGAAGETVTSVSEAGAEYYQGAKEVVQDAVDDLFPKRKDLTA